jgi:hypothetical protein
VLFPLAHLSRAGTRPPKRPQPPRGRARGATTLLHKLTTGFFVLFVITSLSLAIMQAPSQLGDERPRGPMRLYAKGGHAFARF